MANDQWRSDILIGCFSNQSTGGNFKCANVTNVRSECDPSREGSTSRHKAQDHNLDDFETQWRSKYQCQEQDVIIWKSLPAQEGAGEIEPKYSRCSGACLESNTNIVCITTHSNSQSERGYDLSGTGSCPPTHHVTLKERRMAGGLYIRITSGRQRHCSVPGRNQDQCNFD